MEFVRNTWYPAVWSDDLGRSLLARTFLNERVVLYRKQDGTPAALHDVCPHRIVPLSMGKLEGDDVECLYHGLRFNCRGDCIDNPNGTGTIPKAARVQAYPVYEKWSMVWIWMGNPELADPSMIPDLPWMTDTDHYTAIHGTLKLQANYLLVMDNLTDLSHASFIHCPSLEPREMAREIFKITEEDGAVWTRLSHPAMLVPEFFKLMGNMPERMDHWLEMRCHPPGVMVTFYDVAEVGSPRDHGYLTANPNLIVPETDYTTHYFWGSCRNFSLGDDGLSKALYDAASAAFQHEDKPIIEAQQLWLGTRDLMDMQPVLLPNDSGSGRARRMIDRQIALEAKDERVSATR